MLQCQIDLKAVPEFFRVRQTFERPRVEDIAGRVTQQLASVITGDLSGASIAITPASRGVANIAEIIKASVRYCQSKGAEPFIVPAMGSHGGATAAGQTQVLATMEITEQSMGCPIRSDMQVEQVCVAEEGFPVYLDRNALSADHILVVNRVKPHTRFAGEIESGLMKMMLIGLGKQKGAEVYHRVINNFSFDQIVRSVSKEVINRCGVIAGLAVMENAYEETADIVAVAADNIEREEPKLLKQVKQWMPRLPFDKVELLVVDRIGKNISGTGMDTNVIGRKFNDHAAIDGDSPDIHNIYVRDLTEATHGNASGIGLAELCHQRVIEKMDAEMTRMNCVTAGHITGAMTPLAFDSDYDAIATACRIAGFVEPAEVTAMRILDTLHLETVDCSRAFYRQAQELGLEIVDEPRPLDFDEAGNLKP